MAIFKNRHHRPPYRQSWTIEGMQVTIFPVPVLEADFGPAGLKILKIGTGRNFTISASGGQSLVKYLWTGKQYHCVQVAGQQLKQLGR